MKPGRRFGRATIQVHAPESLCGGKVARMRVLYSSKSNYVLGMLPSGRRIDQELGQRSQASGTSIPIQRVWQQRGAARRSNPENSASWLLWNHSSPKLMLPSPVDHRTYRTPNQERKLLHTFHMPWLETAPAVRSARSRSPIEHRRSCRTLSLETSDALTDKPP